MNLEAVYPNDNDDGEELSFEELRAKSRGWLNRDWAAESKQRIAEVIQARDAEDQCSTAASAAKEAVEVLQPARPKPDTQSRSNTQLETTIAVDIGREGKAGRPKKTKVREVKGETQTSMIEGCQFRSKELTSCSHDESRIAYGAEVEAQEICRTYYDSSYQSSHRRYLGHLQSAS